MVMRLCPKAKDCINHDVLCGHSKKHPENVMCSAVVGFGKEICPACVEVKPSDQQGASG
jgi:hypothetical protein